MVNVSLVNETPAGPVILIAVVLPVFAASVAPHPGRVFVSARSTRMFPGPSLEMVLAVVAVIPSVSTPPLKLHVPTAADAAVAPITLRA
jgi:hypothetical protein